MGERAQVAPSPSGSYSFFENGGVRKGLNRDDVRAVRAGRHNFSAHASATISLITAPGAAPISGDFRMEA
jgi:hypothetical protein